MITKTVGSSGADYTTWQAAQDANGDPIDDITFKAITASDLGALTVSMSNTHNKRIIFDANEAVCFRSAAAWPNMVNAVSQSARIGGLLDIQSTLVEVYNLVITGGILIENTCIVGTCIMSGGFSGYHLYHDAFGTTFTGFNLALIANTGGLFNNNGTANLYYCTTSNPAGVGGTFGFWRSGGTVNCYGCISARHGFNDYNGTVGGDENVSDDGTAPGTTNWRNQTGLFVDEDGGDYHLAVAKSGSYPTSDYSGTVPGVALDIDLDARTGAGADAGVDNTAAPPDPPNASYAADSQPCEGSNGTITPTNTGGAITSAAVASGTLPTGYVLNANGTISKTGASMVVGDIGSRTVYVNLTNGGGTQSNVPVSITITANPPIYDYGVLPVVAFCKGTPVNQTFDPSHVSGPAAASFATSGSITAGSFNTTTGRWTCNPNRAQMMPPVSVSITATSTGGQTYQFPFSVQYGFQYVVSVNSGADTATVTELWGSSGSGSGDSMIPSRFHKSRFKTTRFSSTGRFSITWKRN